MYNQEANHAYIGKPFQFGDYLIVVGIADVYKRQPEKSADVRLAQYETGSRTPKADLTAALAQVLDVSPTALSVPDIDSYVCLLYTSRCV